MMRNIITGASDPIALAQLAAAWLSRIGYRVNAQASTFGPLISTYHDLADPAAPQDRRLAACQKMLEPIRRHVIVEQVRAADSPKPFHTDPHGVEFRTTERGAILELIAAILEAAIDAFEQSDIDC